MLDVLLCVLPYQQCESLLRLSLSSDHLTTYSTPSHLQLPTVYWVIPEVSKVVITPKDTVIIVVYNMY